MISGSDSTSSAGLNQDVVGVFDGYSQVFAGARPMTAAVREEAKLMEHPVESGIVVTDHMVIQPVEIELSMTLTPETYRDTYQEIKKLFSEGKLLTVQTRTDSYENQVISALPHEETPDVYDTVLLDLKLKEVRIVSAEFTAEHRPAKPAQQSTADRGEVQPQEQERKGSWASKHLPIGK